MGVGRVLVGRVGGVDKGCGGGMGGGGGGGFGSGGVGVGVGFGVLVGGGHGREGAGHGCGLRELGRVRVCWVCCSTLADREMVG